tara:strand:- start:281 stop:610 length:330 start_codon:yes stop_codon:yes gene_type:complete
MATLTGYKQDRVGAFIEKDPFAILDYSLDFSNWMPSGDSVASATITVQTISGDASPLAKDSQAINSDVVTATLSAGTAGNVYNVEYKIVTSNALQDSRNIRIKVVERQA